MVWYYNNKLYILFMLLLFYPCFLKGRFQTTSAVLFSTLITYFKYLRWGKSSNSRGFSWPSLRSGLIQVKNNFEKQFAFDSSTEEFLTIIKTRNKYLFDSLFIFETLIKFWLLSVSKCRNKVVQLFHQLLMIIKQL